MSQKNNNYFIKRFTKQENEVHKMSEKKLGQLKAIYREARQELETDLAFFIERYATKNEFDAADLQRMLNITEKAKFRYTIKGYVKEIERLGIDTKEAKALKKELDIMAGRTRVSRKQELLTGINYALGKAGIKSTEVIKNHLIGVVDYVSKNTSAIIGNSLAKFDPKLIERIVNQKWNSENYSDRVWKNRTGLARKVMKNITVGISQGHEFKRMSEKLSKDMNVGYYEARRIIETETTGALENAKEQVYKEMGITKYKFIATIDDRTSKICRALNGKVFDLKDRQIGVNCPFMHPFCRSVTVPVVDREALEKKKQEIREKYKKEIIKRVPAEELERKLPRIGKQKDEVMREKEKVTYFKAIGTKNNIYMEEKTKNSLKLDGFNNKIAVKKVTEYIDDTLSKAFKTIGVKESDFGNLKTIIMTKKNKFASYSPKTNIIYINPLYLGSEKVYQDAFNTGMLKKLTNSDNILSNYVHELTHAYENRYYKKFYKYDDILKIKKENLDKIIDFISKNKYNIEKEISLYAYDKKDNISELLAEAHTRKILGQSNNLIRYILKLYNL